MKKIAESIWRLLKLPSGSPENIADDNQLALKILARLRTECEKHPAHSHADKIA